MNLGVLFIIFIVSSHRTSAAVLIETEQSKPTHKDISSDFKSEVPLLKNNEINKLVDLIPVNSNEKWKAIRLSKEPGREEYTVEISRNNLWKHIIFQLHEEEFTNVQAILDNKLAPLIQKNYWYNGPGKIIETNGKIEFFQNENSKAIKLNANLKGPFDDQTRWVIMAESNNAFVGRRLNDYGEGSLYYFSKKNNSEGRHLYLAFRMPIDPKMRFELRLDDKELKIFDLKTGKAKASGELPHKISRRATAISSDGEQLIAYTESVFFVVKLNQGKKIEIGPPRSFLVNGLAQNVAGAAFTNSGKPVVLSVNGVVRVY